MYQKEGLSPYPEAVSAALNDYTRECDTLAQFIEECYVKVPHANTLMKDFTARYNECCKLNHYPPSNSRTLASELRNEGWTLTNGLDNKLTINNLGLRDEAN